MRARAESFMRFEDIERQPNSAACSRPTVTVLAIIYQLHIVEWARQFSVTVYHASNRKGDPTPLRDRIRIQKFNVQYQ